jgi:hypothetical protein
MRSLIIHKTLFNALLALNDEDIGAIMRSAMLFTADEAHYVPPENPALAFAWEVIKEQIITHGKKYEETCQRKSDAARAAADARWHPSAFQTGKMRRNADAMPEHDSRTATHRLSAK